VRFLLRLKIRPIAAELVAHVEIQIVGVDPGLSLFGFPYSSPKDYYVRTTI
jgi:hypothetical protein